MNTKLKFIGLLAILPLALVALTPDLIGEADAAFSHDGVAFEERWGSTSNAGIEDISDVRDGSAFEKRLASLEN